ncbi:MAG: D-aminoacyl-tRNA deacylase [Chloroflexota bacterium]|nr:D-aminoacyl-tRNA deacylase [Chloroflexota bacterium]
MKVLLQRVRSASVRVAGETVGEIGCGLLLLVGVAQGDTPEVATGLAAKVAGLRIFSDEAGRLLL